MRACKTSAEERALIAKESAAIRGSLKEGESAYRHRNVAKLMFMHMLGYPTHFGQMECVRLIASAGFPEKRVGYLGLMILLDERQEVTMLVTNSIKNDLGHKNHFIVGLALCSLGNICTAEMARDVAPEVAALLSSKNSYVRKKAALCAIRVIKKVPELADGFLEGASNLLADRHHGVLLCAVTLALQLCRVDPAHRAMFRAHVPTLVRILKSLIHSGYSAEHDVSGHADPFLQVKLLRLLATLGAGDADASDAMSDVLANVASNTDGSKNAGNAILYEAVTAIVGVESIGGLRVLAVNILGRFLANKDNNVRYVALNTLAKVVAVDTQAVQRHRQTIVECVKDSDVTIRRSALQLVYNLVNENNIETLARELLEYLSVADVEFKADLSKRIAGLVAKYAPNPRWRVDTLVELLTRGGSHVADEECRSFVQLVTNAPHLQGYAGRALYRAACDERSHFQLAAVASWVLGEYGDAVVSNERLEGEPGLVVSRRDVVGLLDSVLSDPHTPGPVKQVTATALAKLAARFPDEAANVRAAVERVGGSLNLELQQRAAEFVKIFDKGPALSAPLLERMPPFERKSDATGGGLSRSSSGAAAPAPAAATGADLLGDLMGLDDTPSTTTGAGTTVAAGADLLGDLMGISAAPATAPAPAAAIDPLAALMGGASLDVPAANANANAKAPAARADPMADLMGLDAAPAPAPAAAAVPAADPMADLFGAPAPAPAAAPASASASASASTFAAYRKEGFVVTFSCTKPDPTTDPGTTVIAATYSNEGAAPMRGFSLQAAVPKTMTLSLAPASGSDLPGSGAGTIAQTLTVRNSQHGTKPLAMRLRMSWTDGGGAAVIEQATVEFPPGI